MDVILVIAVTWLSLLLFALSILRAAGRAERAAEQAFAQRTPRPATEHRNRVTTAVVMAAALPFAGAGVAAPDAEAQSCRGARSAPGASAPSVTLCLINAERRARGLSPLSVNARLARAAQRHAADMVARAYFSHFSPSGSSFTDRLRRVGYARSGCAWSGGETLAWGSGTSQTPASRVAGWMASPPHRAIILSAFHEAGIGVVAGSPTDAGSGATYVGEFGRRRC